LLVDEFLSESAVRFPDRVAIVSGGERLTYASVGDAARRLSAGLQSLGVRRGDRVVIHLENGIEAALSIFGTWYAGAVIVIVNPTTRAEKLAFILTDCQATVLVTDVRSAGVASEAWRLLAHPVATVFVRGDDAPASAEGAPGPVVPFDALMAAGRNHESAQPRPIDLDNAAIVYTSGSTGIPKGVVLTHGNIVAAATSIIGFLELTADDVVLNVLPLSFDYGLYQVLMTFKVGARLVLERSFAYPSLILQLLARERVTGFPIVPTIAALIVRHDLTAFDFSSLRYISSTGAVLPTPHIAALRQQLPHVRVFSMYGITESKRVSYLPPEEIDARPTSVGKSMDNVEVFVADDEGNLQTHGVGELVVRGSNVMREYWGRPEETAQALRPGLLPGERVLFTGDTFRIDADGYLYFVGRKDDIIKSCGEKVSPKEVENVLYACPGVVETAVIGVPDPVLGSAVKAFVVVDAASGPTENDILRYCAARMEDVMIPKSIDIVRELPRTSTGKINHAALRQGLTA
jgi:acyl-CoA synthetase (AMP-forming)/AMP-acid ligase II